MDNRNARLDMLKGARVTSISIKPYTRFYIDSRTHGICCEEAPDFKRRIMTPSEFSEKYKDITDFENI